MNCTLGTIIFYKILSLIREWFVVTCVNFVLASYLYCCTTCWYVPIVKLWCTDIDTGRWIQHDMDISYIKFKTWYIIISCNMNSNVTFILVFVNFSSSIELFNLPTTLKQFKKILHLFNTFRGRLLISWYPKYIVTRLLGHYIHRWWNEDNIIFGVFSSASDILKYLCRFCNDIYPMFFCSHKAVV